jgi:hypothetical protein
MNYTKISDILLRDLLESVEGSGANAMWSYVCEDIPEISSASYEERKHYFLSVMYRLMKEGRMKLASDGKFLEGTIEEQVQRYSDLWPKEESLLDKVDFQFTADADGNLIDLWPEGGFVWVYEDGSEEWSYTA